MGRVLRVQRKGASPNFKAHTHRRKGPVQLRVLDICERKGFIRGIVKSIVHDKGRGAPLARIQFKALKERRRETSNWVAVEGIHTGQYIYCGAKGNRPFGAPTYLFL